MSEPRSHGHVEHDGGESRGIVPQVPCPPAPSAQVDCERHVEVQGLSHLRTFSLHTLLQKLCVHGPVLASLLAMHLTLYLSELTHTLAPVQK